MTDEQLITISSGYELAVRVTGDLEHSDNPPIIFCDGSIFTYVQFDPVFFPKLKKYLHHNHPIIQYDYVGYGNSSVLEGEFDFVLISDRLIELMNVLKIKKAHLFGYSKGSVIAQIAAAKYPDRILSIGGYGNPNLANPESNEMAKQDFGTERLYRANKLKDIFDQQIDDRNVDRVYNTVYVPHIFGKEVNQLGIFEKIKNMWIRSKLQPMMRNTRVDIMAKLFRYYSRDITDEETQRYIDAIRSIQCPVLLMHGSGDETVPLSSSITLDGLIPDSRLVIFDGYRHSQPILIPWEGGKIMKKYVEFLESL